MVVEFQGSLKAHAEEQARQYEQLLTECRRNVHRMRKVERYFQALNPVLIAEGLAAVSLNDEKGQLYLNKAQND